MYECSPKHFGMRTARTREDNGAKQKRGIKKNFKKCEELKKVPKVYLLLGQTYLRGHYFLKQSNYLTKKNSFPNTRNYF